MRLVSRRFAAVLPAPNRWVTLVEWSNDGGQTWATATFVAGSVTESALSITRWRAEITLTGVEQGADGINEYSTRLRIHHGLPGELLAMGVYKVRSSSWTSDARHQVSIVATSFECYMEAARFITPRTFAAQRASTLVLTLLREVQPSAQLDWRLADDPTLPKISEPRDRWPLIDGTRDAISIARSVGARIYCGPGGEWIATPVPSLEDDAVWTAAPGQALLVHGESLSDEGVYNAVVANGQPTDGSKPFAPGVAQDLDPTSPTYVGLGVDAGGFGLRPLFYTSQLFTTTAQAARAAQGMLAPLLGLRQQVEFTSVHDPRLQPGDVGIVGTVKGDRRVILDEVTHDLTGGPTSAQTRTTATRYAGQVSAVGEVDGGE
mgnify:CR=1 FL=1